jgi:hypothetical protein
VVEDGLARARRDAGGGDRGVERLEVAVLRLGDGDVADLAAALDVEASGDGGEGSKISSKEKRSSSLASAAASSSPRRRRRGHGGRRRGDARVTLRR